MNNILQLGKSCCGCSGCEQICPKKCITIQPDSEGFLYPVVDESKCVDCGLCVRHCPIMTDAKRCDEPKVYAAKYKDCTSAFKSTSGGLFIPLAKEVLAKGGVVFGCAYDENLVARHIAVSNESELYKLQSSKYVQSDTRGIYKQVKTLLADDKYVLFSGTGCQVAGLKTFLNKDCEKLLTVDIVCHGVPSPALFKNYVDYMGRKLGGKLTSYNFRSKEKRGWDLYYKAENGKKSKSDYGFFDPYYSAFLYCKTYRESCYECKFANKNRVGDISLADFWGIQKFHPDFYDENGVSLVLVNTEKGKDYFDLIKDRLEIIESDYEKASAMNSNLVVASERPACRDTIYDGFDGLDFDSYVKTKLAFKVNPKTKIKKMIPLGVKRVLKKLH